MEGNEKHYDNSIAGGSVGIGELVLIIIMLIVEGLVKVASCHQVYVECQR